MNRHGLRLVALGSLMVACGGGGNASGKMPRSGERNQGGAAEMEVAAGGAGDPTQGGQGGSATQETGGSVAGGSGGSTLSPKGGTAVATGGTAAQGGSGGTTASVVTGQGAYKFKVALTSDALPALAKSVLADAHGGFAVDHREGFGQTYWSLPGAGILQISSNLKEVRLLTTAAIMAQAILHNTTIWYPTTGDPFLIFPGNRAAAVFTTDLKGNLVHTLGYPTDPRFQVAAVNDYFGQKKEFKPTDVEYLQGLYYVTTGYSELDYVLTAKVSSTNPFKAEWDTLAFGGRGTGPGQFGTGHGITIRPGTTRIDIADRPNSQIDRFTSAGKYIDTFNTPAGSLPCDIDYLEDYALIPALDGPDKTKGAPIYLYEKDTLVSTIMIKEDLGLKNFLHIHNAVLRKIDGILYIIAQAWNPGDFAILEQVNAR